jgi:3-hydroxyisobutyrate dehydrogenase
MDAIAFIGLGNMGAPMALNLLKAGCPLSVYDVVPDAVQKLAAAGAMPAADIATAVAAADIVITMLPATEQAREVYLGPGGVIAHAKKGATLIDCSTINAEAAREIATQAREKGFEMIDAPVSGGVAGAQNAALTFIVGGSVATLHRVQPVLEKMGRNVMHAGPSGAGQVAKICNNMLLGILMIGTSEALNLGAANGLDPKVLSNIIAKSSGRNWALEIYNPMPGVMEDVPAARGYSGGFLSDLMLKDLDLARQAASATHAATPLGQVAWQLYQQHSRAGNGRLDFSSIFRLVSASGE